MDEGAVLLVFHRRIPRIIVSFYFDGALTIHNLQYIFPACIQLFLEYTTTSVIFVKKKYFDCQKHFSK